MGNVVSTITSKWQVTIPEQIRSELPLNIGQRIAWEVQGDSLVARRVRTARELSGSLKPLRKGTAPDASKRAFARAAIEREKRLLKQRK
jgi:bifunctional DNA-binding transcriptional regulator/antitoxin component of YhaV-PrlF toxin-antitoxin module